MIQSQRRRNVCPARKSHQTQPIIAALINKTVENTFCDLKTIDAFTVLHEVHGSHAGAQIQSDHHINTTGFNRSFSLTKTRPSHRNNAEDQDKPTAQSEQ